MSGLPGEIRKKLKCLGCDRVMNTTAEYRMCAHCKNKHNSSIFETQALVIDFTEDNADAPSFTHSKQSAFR